MMPLWLVTLVVIAYVICYIIYHATKKDGRGGDQK
jgi:hypothetical protein